MFKRSLEILANLVSFPSVSSTSNREVSLYVHELLNRVMERSEYLSYEDSNRQEKGNVVATVGTGTGGLVYCAHSDVVPATSWDYPHAGPFELHESDQRVYGRGSCDMKGSLACFLAALEEVLKTVPAKNLKGPISVICTADEEIGYHGAACVAARSEIYRGLVSQQPVTIIGEPTRLQVIHAHKGMYVFRATSRGVALHSSGETRRSANLKMIPFLQEMWEIEQETYSSPAWNDSRFTPSGIGWNIGFNDFTYATNITAERSVCTVSFRPMPEQAPSLLLERARRKADELGLEFEVLHDAPPVYVEPGASHIQDLLELTETDSSYPVSYGTDGAMFHELERMVVCGPGDIAQAHTSDEWISLEQMQLGCELYRKAIERFCC